MDPTLTHTLWGRNWHQSLDEIIWLWVLGIWLLITQEKGQPRCKFCLTTTYSNLRIAWAMTKNLADAYCTTIASFQKECLAEKKKESFQSLCFTDMVTLGLLVGLQNFERIPWWWIILQPQCWLNQQSVKPLVCMCNVRCFTLRKEREMSLVKFIRQEKIIKVYTTVVTICWTKELYVKGWKSSTLRFTSSLGCKTSYIVCRNQCKMKWGPLFKNVLGILGR